MGENTQKLIEDERSIEQAVLAAVAVRDFEENKRKRREELDAAEEEAAKKARRSLGATLSKFSACLLLCWMVQ